MKADFDVAAQTYDEDFTQSKIGALQREMVWRELDKILNKTGNGIRVLELNCGTGEDAVRLAKRGNQVVATDVSEGMLEVARSKGRGLDITYSVLDLNFISEFSSAEPFDMVFSNFGGLNCLEPEAIKRLRESLPRLLNKNGRFVAIVMPQFCIWETLFFTLKAQFTKAFRRRKKYVYANVSGEQVKTFYYSPARFTQLIGKGLMKQKVKPIGLFVPPSYLERFFSKRSRALNGLYFLERLSGRFGWQSGLSDHYYIEFEKP